MSGTIKNLREGFGFLRGEDGLDRFFLPGAITDGTAFASLTVGDRVEFEHLDHERGSRARNIRLTAKAAPTPTAMPTSQSATTNG